MVINLIKKKVLLVMGGVYGTKTMILHSYESRATILLSAREDCRRKYALLLQEPHFCGRNAYT